MVQMDEYELLNLTYLKILLFKTNFKIIRWQIYKNDWAN